jgi:hypothetical protein
MAIVTHRTSKNARYADVLDYYSYKHEENQATGHYEPILDENGLMQERDDYAVAYLTAQGQEEAPELWASACMRTNLLHRKNLDEGDRKSHEYIISHPAEDRARMTMDDLMEEGKAFAREHLKGYDCLISVHRDTDNDHIHISINSVRALEREEQDWMMKKNGQTIAAEMSAGGKHQDSPQLRRHMNDWLLDYTREHGFVAKDNNAIADVHRAERHGSKNDQMRTALLEAAGRSKDLKELQHHMKADYNMELKIRGETLSVQHPDSKKAVRLRTLGLEAADLTRRMSGEQYAYTQATDQQQEQKEIEQAEKKKQIEWIRERRQRNNEKAEDAAARAEQILAQRLRAKGDRYNKQDFQDLNYLIRQSAYVAAGLQTEKDKLDRMLERWEKYQDPALSEQERRQHGGYIRWCGCDPDNALELADLRAEREIIEAQQDHAKAMHEALMAEAEQWKGLNNLTYSENNLAWQKQREKQLKQQLKNIKASRKKLWEISYNCEMSARKYGKVQNYEKAAHFRGKWAEKVWKEREIQQKLKETKQKKKEAKAQVKQARKRAKELDLGR